MKRILIIIIIFTATVSHAQSFEGTLTYVSNFDVSEKFEKMGITKQALIDKMKQDGTWSDTIRTTYKMGNYYTLLNNHEKSFLIYKSETNKIYAFQNGKASTVCTVTDASIDLEFTLTGNMPEIKKLDSTAVVEGVNCSIVRVKWKSGTYDYYFNTKKLVIDPLPFSKHKYDGWADFLNISNALPLKIVKASGGMMTITTTLVLTKPEIVNENIFSIPTLISDEKLSQAKIANREIMRIKK